MTIDDRLRQAAAALNEAVKRRIEADQQPPPPTTPPGPGSDRAATAGSGTMTAPLAELGRGSLLIPFAASGGWTASKPWPQADWPTAYGQVLDLIRARLLAQEGQVVEYLGDGILAVFGRDDAAKATPAIEIQQQARPVPAAGYAGSAARC
jgi:class 3 adenylate cyclase